MDLVKKDRFSLKNPHSTLNRRNSGGCNHCIDHIFQGGIVHTICTRRRRRSEGQNRISCLSARNATSDYHSSLSCHYRWHHWHYPCHWHYPWHYPCHGHHLVAGVVVAVLPLEL